VKGLAGVAILLMLGLSIYNWYEIRNLRQEIVRLEMKVNETNGGGLSNQALDKAMELMVQARVALANTDWTKARSTYESARQQLSAAASTAGQKAAPTLRWLQDQAHEIENQINKRSPDKK
jgi:hypothetical protein